MKRIFKNDSFYIVYIVYFMASLLFEGFRTDIDSVIWDHPFWWRLTNFQFYWIKAFLSIGFFLGLVSIIRKRYVEARQIVVLPLGWSLHFFLKRNPRCMSWICEGIAEYARLLYPAWFYIGIAMAIILLVLGRKHIKELVFKTASDSLIFLTAIYAMQSNQFFN